jgi:hypothetical protein
MDLEDEQQDDMPAPKPKKPRKPPVPRVKPGTLKAELSAENRLWRERVAIAAMQSLILNARGQAMDNFLRVDIAKRAFQFADAMLGQR